MPNAELLKLVEALRDYDHAFLTTEGAMHFSKPFGFTARTAVHHANPTQPKGLTLDNGADSAEGIDAADLAQQICRHVGVVYTRTYGRGSQLRSCCDALEAWCNKP